ncbi:hypothetical protein BKA62DRAFT_621318 [Auriculariales sp. MPI-PUGE-AT-0066]|nr:hypothetical protein BKA62DRAFT_621318 [Auriculariales sp. MPI-PUGE-AT-0066]
MALVAHTIVSRLTGPVAPVEVEADLDSLAGSVEDGAASQTLSTRALTSQELDAEWRMERAYGPNAHHAPIDFVPARYQFDDFGHLLGQSSLAPKSTTTAHGDSLGSWYKGLLRTNAPPVCNHTALIDSPTARSPSTGKKDWFIQNVLAESSSSRTPPSVPQTLSDMLARQPPTEKGVHVPVWTHIGPGNRGFALLQRAGWEEGTALGARSSATTRTSIWPEVMERKPRQDIEVIDLTRDDDEELTADNPTEEESEDDHEQLAEDDSTEIIKDEPMGDDENTPHGTALLVPLPAFLKPDKHGIGLRTQKERRKMRLRDTSQALGLDNLKPGAERHVRLSQEARRRREKVGRGARGYTRESRYESGERQDMMRYMHS